jgi:hypothetical protein
VGHGYTKSYFEHSINTLSFAALYHESHQPPPLQHMNFIRLHTKNIPLAHITETLKKVTYIHGNTHTHTHNIHMYIHTYIHTYMYIMYWLTLHSTVVTVFTTCSTTKNSRLRSWTTCIAYNSQNTFLSTALAGWSLQPRQKCLVCDRNLIFRCLLHETSVSKCLCINLIILDVINNLSHSDPVITSTSY